MLEISDVVLFITDIRHPVSKCCIISLTIIYPIKVLHFSPALCNHVNVDLKKQLVLVLNKVPILFCVAF